MQPVMLCSRQRYIYNPAGAAPSRARVARSVHDPGFTALSVHLGPRGVPVRRCFPRGREARENPTSQAIGMLRAVRRQQQQDWWSTRDQTFPFWCIDFKASVGYAVIYIIWLGNFFLMCLKRYLLRHTRDKINAVPFQATVRHRFKMRFSDNHRR